MSQTVLIDTISVPVVITNSANVTAASVTEPIPTTTKPSGDGVVRMGDGGQVATSGVKLQFFGVGADTNTFLAYVYGWEQQRTSTIGNLDLWIPTLLASFSGITLDSAQPGVAPSDIGPTQYFATAITLVTGNSGISVEVVSPGHATHEIAQVVVSTKGAKFIEVRMATGSSATSCNCLCKRM